MKLSFLTIIFNFFQADKVMNIVLNVLTKIFRPKNEFSLYDVECLHKIGMENTRKEEWRIE